MLAPSKIELLELDIDIRLADLWAETMDVQEWSLDVAAAFMRAAYGKAYINAHRERGKERGSLCTANGYKFAI